MAPDGSVTGWIGQVKAGDAVAAQKLWERYFTRLIGFCRKKLAHHPRRMDDEEDVVLSAFDSFFRGANEGHFPQLRDRNNLWPLLVKIAARKAVDHIQHARRKKRGGGQVRGESAIDAGRSSQGWGDIEQVIGDEPTPELAATVAEEYERLMACLPDETLRTVAQLKMEGYTNKEIARRLDCSQSTIDRKLLRIRITWSEEGPGNG